MPSEVKQQKPYLYQSGGEPKAGYCPVCNRSRPIDKSTVSNFGCYEFEADDEDRDDFGPGDVGLSCAGCGATCVPVFEPPTAARQE
jgi:hypothetical protein